MASVARADVTRLLVIRHGETVWNVEGRVQGYMDSPLTTAGEAQAAALGRRFAGAPPHALVGWVSANRPASRTARL